MGGGGVVVGRSRTNEQMQWPRLLVAGWLAVLLTLASLHLPQRGDADANVDVMRAKLALWNSEKKSASIMDRSDTAAAALSDRRMTREMDLNGKMICDSVGKRCYLSPEAEVLLVTRVVE
ncbi:hypothetical protein LX32DRAFT_680630 [Colletotrichum zoysiae]|uniref:Uncharacterized protein n=1 Tax=Colletotrichum zoysiae TaxID=1216348 RepID=A0AAD9HPU3_9PEZI|nr:hypothetical protein LX32DRAFT_680630 [Colletotrichum zoysiae]